MSELKRKWTVTLFKGLENKMQAEGLKEVNFHGSHKRNKGDTVFNKIHMKDHLKGRLISPVISGSKLLMAYK